MPRTKFSGSRSIHKKKKEEIDPAIMGIYGLKCKDPLGNPFFLPTDEGGIVQNMRCQLTKEQFEANLRAYMK